MISLDEIDFIENDGRKVQLYSGDRTFQLITTKSELEELLLGEGFDLFDRVNLVNVKRIKSYDRDKGRVYFTETPTRESKFASIAKIKQDLIESFVMRAISINTGSTIGVKSDRKSAFQSLKSMFLDN
jgi:DNA-binding LytR/AlgR family response regulator